MSAEITEKLQLIHPDPESTPSGFLLQITPDGTIRQWPRSERTTGEGTFRYLKQRVPGSPPAPVEDFNDMWEDNLGPYRDPLEPSRQEKAIRAIVALQAAVVGDHAAVESFATDAELWPGPSGAVRSGAKRCQQHCSGIGLIRF